MITLDSKAFVDEAEALLAAIRGGVLVHVQEGVRPGHLKVPLDYAHLLNGLASDIDDDQVRSAAEALEMWLSMLAAESEPISQTRTNSLLDQISEVEKSLLAYRSTVSAGAPDLADFLDESFETMQVHKGITSSPTTPPDTRYAAEPDPEPERAQESQYDLQYSEPPETDPEILEVFGDETESLLESIQTNLQTLSQTPSDRKALWEIKKSAHTLKGAAGIVGLKKLSKLAHRVEDLLDRLSERNSDSDAGLVRLLGDTAECFKALSTGYDSGGIDAKVVSLHRRLDAALNAVSQSAEIANTPGPATRRASTGPSRLQNAHSTASPRKSGSPIVRVSLERLDELVRNVRDLVASQSSFEQRFDAFGRQLDETHNNALRLQKAMGKVEGLRLDGGPLLPERSSGDSKQVMYELAETARDATLIYTELDKVRHNLSTLNTDQRALIDQIEQRLMRLRNVEFGSIASRLQRTIRVTCDEEGKDAELVIENGRLEIDTQVIDSLIEPLLHLLKNAVVHGIEWPETRRMLGKPELGKITVRVGNKGSNVMISVTDDGRGIAFRPLLEKAVASNMISRVEAEKMTPDRIRELIFLPGLTTAEKLSLNAGRGVGMTIVRECVAAAGGVISIETWPQKGTTFSIRIPRPFADVPTPDHIQVTPFETTPNELTVLIVDDSPSVRLMTSRAIVKAGWHFETAINGIDALEKLRSIRRPNVILSDIEMPRMGGYELVAALRDDETFKNIPVIFISSRTSDRDQASDAGGAEYLTKPYDERRLIELIADLAVPNHSVTH